MIMTCPMKLGYLLVVYPNFSNEILPGAIKDVEMVEDLPGGTHG